MHKRTVRRVLVNILYSLATLGLILLIWYLAAVSIDVEIILPRPSLAFRRLWELLTESVFWGNVGATLLRSVLGFLLALIPGVLLAVAAFLFRPVYQLLNPLVMVLRAVPTMSVILLCILWVSSKVSPIIIAFLIVFPVIFSAVYGALCAVDHNLIEMSALYRVPKGRQVFSLYLPAVAPEFFQAARSSVGLNLKIVIASEALALTKQSIGNMLQESKALLDTPQLFAYTIIAIVLSFLLELLVEAISRLVVRWR